MTPTPEQKQWLKNYLYKVMTYRETYEEVYDHMLLSIEDHAEQQYFATTVLEILNRDFGGSNGLVELEENCRQAVAVTAKAEFRYNFKRWFLSPLLVVTIAMFFGLFYMQLPKVETGGALFILFAVLLVLPTIQSSVRAFILGYKYGSSKRSIRDDVFRKIAFTANRNLLLIVVLIKIEDVIQQDVFHIHIPEKAISMNVIYGVITVVFVLMIINVLSVIKLHRSEFKANMITT
jgi:hypothetical protein